MNLFTATESILLQLNFVINNLSREEFSRPLISLNNSTIGQHIRHTVEFFICLLNTDENGIVNYDKREHNKEIETDNEKARSVLSEITFKLSSSPQNIPLQLEGCYSICGTENYLVDTNLYRELAYNIEHAVHHMALLKIGLTEVKPALELPAHFGIAVSTIRYKKAEAVQPK
ncbi:MAG: hypothetical protein OEW75_06045 [Cyclobacteriaceae bacterium]|nr:hypothetical protein [Cyclobacteriaceae bacterium]